MENLQNRVEKTKEPGKGAAGRLENKLEAWLTFIASDRPEDIMEVIRSYPEFEEMYREVFDFRYQKQEKEIQNLTRTLEEERREVERLRKLLKEREEM